MPLDDLRPDLLLPVMERRRAGRSLRKLAPRSQHAKWSPPVSRRTAVEILMETGRHRIAGLLPIRYARMRESPLAFLRGSAAVMAADLAETPSCGIWVQAGGDCHLANFGTFASPEGTPLFDINDFDETLPAPFEWDLKRLATSFVVAARSQKLPDADGRKFARAAAHAYRVQMHALARLDPFTAWRTHTPVAELLADIEDRRIRERECKRLQAATTAAHKGYPHLLEKRRDGWRIRKQPSLIFPLAHQHDDTYEIVARSAFMSYKENLPEERRMLLDRYRLVDVAFKVVGVGSVGTFCAIGLFTTGDGAPLLLQLKEAQASVLAPFAGPSVYANQGQRVVAGQRLMQTQGDIFLGWTHQQGDDQHCYVRQLKDPKLAAIGKELEPDFLPHHAVLCGLALARAHARSGDAARMAGYMGSSTVFDSAIVTFATAYAAQVEHDWRQFLDAIESGLINATPV